MQLLIRDITLEDAERFEAAFWNRDGISLQSSSIVIMKSSRRERGKCLLQKQRGSRSGM